MYRSSQTSDNCNIRRFEVKKERILRTSVKTQDHLYRIKQYMNEKHELNEEVNRKHVFHRRKKKRKVSKESN